MLGTAPFGSPLSPSLLLFLPTFLSSSCLSPFPFSLFPSSFPLFLPSSVSSLFSPLRLLFIFLPLFSSRKGKNEILQLEWQKDVKYEAREMVAIRGKVQILQSHLFARRQRTQQRIKFCHRVGFNVVATKLGWSGVYAGPGNTSILSGTGLADNGACVDYTLWGLLDSVEGRVFRCPPGEAAHDLQIWQT